MFDRPVIRVKVKPATFFKLLVVFSILSGIVNSIAIPYTINTWLLYFGKVAVVTGWHGFFIGLIPVIGELTIVLAILTWVIMLFLV